MKKKMTFGEYLNWLDEHRKEWKLSSRHLEGPPSPGKILNDEYLKKRNISQTGLSKKIGCTHAKINEVIHGKRGITPEFALDLERVTSIRADAWMRMQVAFELYQLRRKKAL